MNNKISTFRDSLRRLLPADNLLAWLPSRGNILFTLLVAFCLIGTSRVWAAPQSVSAQAGSSTTTIAYQGRLADSSGAALDGDYIITFRLYNVASGGLPLWEEFWIGGNNVHVTNGLFNVLLGSLTPIPQSVIIENSSLWLGIDVGADLEMTPRVQLSSVPYAVQALTVPDASVTTAKLVDGSVTLDKLDLANGRFKDVTGYVAPVGTIVMYAGATPPQGWLLADGSAISRTTYQDLFTAIATTFGNGDGSSTFNLPNLQGRVPFGKASAGTFATLGGNGGAETHNHGGNTGVAGSHQHNTPIVTIDNSIYGIPDDPSEWPYGMSGFVGSMQYRSAGGASGPTSVRTLLTSPAGDHSHTISSDSNVPPFVVVNYIIKY